MAREVLKEGVPQAQKGPYGSVATFHVCSLYQETLHASIGFLDLYFVLHNRYSGVGYKNDCHCFVFFVRAQ